MYQNIFKKYLFPFYENRVCRRQTPAYMQEYFGNLHRSTEELEAVQLTKLRRLLCHAYISCSYYRQQWDKLHFDPNSLSDIKDLERLPVIDKQTITENYSGFIANGYGVDNIKKSTGGSSGVPFSFELDQESNQRRQAIMWRGYGWLGAGLGVKALYVWGANIQPTGLKSAFKERMYHAFYNRKMLNSFNLNESNIMEYLEEFSRYKPDVVVGYVGPLVALADYVLTHGIKVRSPKSILTGAEPLYEFQREKIEKAFSAPVYNTYGCREFMLIGAECKNKKGLHLNIDHLVVEVVGEKNSNEDSTNEESAISSQSGQLVITDLHNYGFPLIRYANGDKATLGNQVNCDCGSPLPLMQSVDGRKLDVIRTPGGRILSGEFFPHLLKDFKQIKQFQVIQNVSNEIEIKLVLNSAETGNDAEIDKIQQLIQKSVGHEVMVNILIVGKIDLTISGKLRVVISNI